MNIHEEKQLREFVRKTFVKQMLEQKKKEALVEQKARLWVRSLISEIKKEKSFNLISEARDAANPHPNTGINKLRDAIRKAKPSIKTKFQQLTSAKEQRESFSNHLLAAFVRLFDQLDALSASNEVEQDVEDTEKELGSTSTSGDSLSAPPSDDELEKELEDELGQDIQLESILRELDLSIDDQEADQNDIVSDEIKDEKETEKNKGLTKVEKDVKKKQAQEMEREEFGKGIEGDATGRNQAYDAFNLVQTYFSDNYLDLDSTEDRAMFKKWGLYNLKLLLDSYEEELTPNLEKPEIPNPQ